MADFGNSFDTTKPIGSDYAKDLDTIIEAQTKVPLNDRYGLEHVPLNSSETGATDKDNDNAQGRHIAGAVSVLFKGSNADITTFVGKYGKRIGKGALAFSETDGAILYFDGDEFVTLGLTAVAYAAGDGLTLTDNTFSVDPASEDDMVTGSEEYKPVVPALAKWSYGLVEYMEVYKTATEGTDSTEVLGTDTVRTLDASAVVNTIIDSALVGASGTIELPAGVYEVDISVCAAKIDGASSTGFVHKAVLYNTTLTETTLEGLSSGITNTSQEINSVSTIQGTFTITETCIFEIRHSVAEIVGIPTDIIGGCAFGNGVEKYISCHIWKKKLVGA